MNKNKFLLLFILCCVLPLAAAKVVLELGWFNPGSSSKGHWLEQEIFLLDNISGQKKHWRIVLLADATCDQQCNNALHTVKQLYIGLGRKQEQVQPVVVGRLKEPEAYPMFIQQQALAVDVSSLQQQILLVDQKGLVLLSYAMPEQEEQMAETARNIRYDLLKLLNYDRTSV
ncbi:hypothetical protein WG68_14865 [Arsukibacterium ikkense]|uniref:Transmembrane cytochrome oxidase associated protein n=1 Tax=Arsukibacterium ikkense TaxID=336831 RepID=A0A0M2V5X9_9GAMM|nr:hypothetical protein [Arsukibacterium ikkense]KKO44578.1 hypothetical protein WG68_14865 [Arsukibacterium ikkense]